MIKESFLEMFTPLEFSTLSFAYVYLGFLNTTLLANPIVLIVAAIAGLVAAFI